MVVIVMYFFPNIVFAARPMRYSYDTCIMFYRKLSVGQRRHFFWGEHWGTRYMEKISATCAMGWSIELEKGLRSKRPGKNHY